MDNNAMFSASECARRYHVTRSEWYRMVKDGQAPQPESIGQRKLWARDTLVEWEEQVLAEHGFCELPMQQSSA